MTIQFIHTVARSALALAAVSVTACGEASVENDGVSTEVVETTTHEGVDLFVLNAIHPDAVSGSLGDFSEVDVAVDGECVVASLAFRSAQGPRDEGWGLHVVRAMAADASESCAGAVVASADDLELGTGVRTTIAVWATAERAPRFAAFQSPRDTMTRLAVRHTAATGPLVVSIDGAPAAGELLDLGEELVVELEAGLHTVSVEPSGDSTAAIERELELADGHTVAAHVVAGPELGDLELVELTLDTP